MKAIFVHINIPLCYIINYHFKKMQILITMRNVQKKTFSRRISLLFKIQELNPRKYFFSFNT